MKQPRWHSLAFSALLLSGGFVPLAHASLHLDEAGSDTSLCAYESRSLRKAKFVFVTFPAPVDGDEVEVPELGAAYQQVAALYLQYFEATTAGYVDFDAEDPILLHPGEGFEPGDLTPTPWLAECTAATYSDYQNFAGDCEVQTCGEALTCELLDSSWWSLLEDSSTGSSVTGAVCAYVLHEVWQEYLETPDYSSLADIDELYFIFLTQNRIFDPDIGGTTGLGSINLATINVATGGCFQDLCTACCTRQAALPPFDVRDLACVLAHEYAHTWGPKDGPPNLLDIAPDDQNRYYYGNLNLLCQHFLAGYALPDGYEGLPPIGLGWVEETPFYEVVDVTGQNLRSVRLYDLRNQSADPARRGKIYKFSQRVLHQGGSSLQSFYLAYHSGRNWVDTQPSTKNPAGPLLRSQGLEVWHTVQPNNASPFMDIESAFGLWLNPNGADFDSTVGWCIPNPVTGFDNHDLWTDTNGQILRDIPGDYDRYAGDSFDFFRMRGGENNTRGSREFSYRSNPTTAWYNFDQAVPAVLRHTPQNRATSFFVRVLDQNNGTSDEDSWIDVAILSAPWEELEEPPAVVDIGTPYTIRWNDPYLPGSSGASNIIDGVTLYYAVDGIHYRKISGNTPLPVIPRQFVWSMGTVDVTDGRVGRIKAVYHNSASSFTNEDTTEPFTVTGDHHTPFENLVVPTGGERFVDGDVLTIGWTAMHPLEDFDEIQVWLEAADGICMAPRRLDAPAELPDLDMRGHAWSWTICLAGTDCTDYRIRLRFVSTHEGVQEWFDSISEPFEIYPGTVHFVDLSQMIRDEGFNYSGTAVFYQPLNFDGDVYGDIVVGKSDERGELFRGQVNSIGPPPNFAGQPSPFSPALQAGTGSASWADFNGDALLDLVFTQRGNSPALIYRNDTGSGLGFVEVSAGISGNQFPTWTDAARHASWGDFNGDGRVDLLVGGESGPKLLANTLNGGEILLENVTPSGWSGRSESGGFVDLDLDGDLDVVELVAPEFGANAVAQYFVNAGPPSFFSVSPAHRLEGSCASAAVAMAWGDIDGDVDLDCVLAHEADCGLELLLNQAGAFVAAEVDPFPAGVSTAIKELRLADIDLDGWLDVAIAFEEDGSRKMSALMNRGAYGALVFTDDGTSIGVAAPNDGTGLLLLDGNRDGDPDLFSAKPCTSGSYWHNERGGGVDAPRNNWVGISIPNTWQAEGARFEFRERGIGPGSGRLLGLRVADCGGFSASRDAVDVVMGLGAYGGDVAVTVTPIGARSHSFTIPGADLNRYNPLPPDIVDGSLIATYTVSPDGSAIWFFKWLTRWSADPARDAVRIVPGSLVGSCGSPPPDLPGTSQVEEVADGLLLHTYTVAGTCSPTCRFNFWVRSGMGALSSDSQRSNQFGVFKTKICASR